MGGLTAGRPRKLASDGSSTAKRLPLNMKASPELRRRIEGAAKKSGLSLAQEVERRLIASFEYEGAADYLRKALGLDAE